MCLAQQYLRRGLPYTRFVGLNLPEQATSLSPTTYAPTLFNHPRWSPSVNRFMVALGFGSLSFFIISLALCESVQAEMAAGSRLVSSASGSAPLVTWHDSIESGWAESKRRKVPMVIFITRGHCRYCDAMKLDTWCDQSIGQQLASDFVAIRLTPKNNAKELDRIKVEAYPTTLIGMPEGKIVDHKVGYQPVREIHSLLSKARTRLQRR
jgi:protein disulfide-isomerase